MSLCKPLERLICGDVGYGKTEVAMRAAFKACYDGKKQVAVLVPTTILAMQHLETFKKRMENFPIQIEMISRFNSHKKNKEILQKTFEGTVDILIGTHRLLSKDVLFQKLGLIIIDEEQRFGVRAKEHLKTLKEDIDSISLSATPIPRSLYLSLIKARDISIISTPPQDRLPIKTIITEASDAIIQNSISRELARDGQVFFLHNRVETIYKRASHIKKMVPSAKISVVHGQMRPCEIDDIFHLFKQGKINLLFTTTIIENGIDIPNCNTILIDNAHTFGLADLYQIRGRVGRWNRSSFCYLFIPRKKNLSKTASLRLSSLLESSNLGSGIKIAMRDLEIRGAGDILGIKQSGQISSIGFSLYCKLLTRALSALKNKKEINFIETKMEFSYPANIPDSYILDSDVKMEIYYRLGDMASFSQVDTMESELTDRFGPPPKEVLWLLDMTKIKIFASYNKFARISFKKFLFYAKQQKTEKNISLPLNIQKNSKTLRNYVIKSLQENFKCKQSF